MKRRPALLMCLLFFASSLVAETVNSRLYINKGTFQAVDSTTFSYFTFNTSQEFSQTNARVVVNVGDSLHLTIVNTDTVDHVFSIRALGVRSEVQKGDSQTVSLRLDAQSTYIIEDDSEQGRYSAMGLSSMLVVRPERGTNFYWNIKEHKAAFNMALDGGATVDWTSYYPDYFTINGLSNPFIDTDSTARVTGAVGDTIYLHMVNTGKAIHSIHFHGYHAQIVQSSKYPSHVGRKKDTFPVHGGEVVILRLVPHQAGEFPVHDHNLVAVTGGGIYPNGMFTTLSIKE